MNLRHMEVFRAVMLTGTVTGAAQLLNVSQPGISKVLAMAERRSGLQLFERLRGRLVPTPEAQRLYREVEDLWRGVQKVRDVARNLAKPESGTLRLAISSSFAPGVVPAVLRELSLRHPAIETRVEILVPHLLVEALLTQGCDLGIALMPNEHPNIAAVAKFQCGLVCVMPSGHRLARRKFVRASDLAGERLVSPSGVPAFAAVLEQAYRDVGEPVQVSTEVRSGAHACWMAQAGVGIALVDAPTVVGNSFANLVALGFRPSPRLDVRLMHNRDRPLSQPARLFCATFERLWKGWRL
ncbi:MAG: LysR family transcriptional regulator [Betaproteobacteria bacterium]